MMIQTNKQIHSPIKSSRILRVAALATLLMGFGSGTLAQATAMDSLERGAPRGHTQPKPPAGENNTAGMPHDLDVCFSPGGGCDQKIIGYINAAQTTLDVAIYSMTHAGIAKAITDAQARGVKVRMVVDRSEAKAKSSAVPQLVSAGVPLKIGKVQGIMHNKFTIVDGQMVETGSYNYSEAATNSNAENQIYMQDSNVVNQYQGDFEKLWREGTPTGNN